MTRTVLPLIFLTPLWGVSNDYPHSTDEKLRLRALVSLAHYSQQVMVSLIRAQRQREDQGGGGFGGAGGTDLRQGLRVWLGCSTMGRAAGT